MNLKTSSDGQSDDHRNYIESEREDKGGIEKSVLKIIWI